MRKKEVDLSVDLPTRFNRNLSDFIGFECTHFLRTLALIVGMYSKTGDEAECMTYLPTLEHVGYIYIYIYIVLPIQPNIRFTP